MALKGNTNEEKIRNFLFSKGLSEAATFGLMGNMYAESGLLPNNLQNSYERKLGFTDASYTLAVDSGSYTNFAKDSAGYGICQWTYGARKQALYDYARKTARSIADLEMQLEFLWQELTTSYKGVLNGISDAKTIREASDIVLTKFERPKDQGEFVKIKRASYGEKFAKNYHKTNNEPKKETLVSTKTVISNCGKDERGQYKNGQAGDQTGKEWVLREWYSKPWKYVLRHPDPNVRSLNADLAKKAALNDNVGYDKNQRTTYERELKRADYDPSKIDTPCEADCSAGVIANVKACGVLLGDDKLKNCSATYTGNMKSGLEKAGFQVLTDRKYLDSSSYLLAGDILLGDGHTCTNITDGAFAREDTEGLTNSPSYLKGHTYTLMVELYVRTGPGKNYLAKKHSELTPDGQKHDTNNNGALNKGTRVTCLDVSYDGEDIWIKTPSGWMAAYYKGAIYIN